MYSRDHSNHIQIHFIMFSAICSLIKSVYWFLNVCYFLVIFILILILLSANMSIRCSCLHFIIILFDSFLCSLYGLGQAKREEEGYVWITNKTVFDNTVFPVLSCPVLYLSEGLVCRLMSIEDSPRDSLCFLFI